MSNLMKQAIKASFLKLLNERPLTRITVLDIAADCGINRNSFYYHYHDIPALVEEIIRDEADSLIRANPAITTPGECVDAVFSFILENHRSINHIYYSVKREIFEQYLMQICTYVTTAWYDSFCREHSTDSPAYDRDLVLRFIRYELFGACIDFLNQDMPPEANEEARRLLEFSLKLIKPEAF